MKKSFGAKLLDVLEEATEFLKNKLHGADTLKIKFKNPIEIWYYSDAYYEYFNKECYSIRIMEHKIEFLDENYSTITTDDFIDPFSLMQITDLVSEENGESDN